MLKKLTLKVIFNDGKTEEFPASVITGSGSVLSYLPPDRELGSDCEHINLSTVSQFSIWSDE